MKFKNIKKKAEKEKLPSNSRAIPESSILSFPKLNSVTLLKIYSGSLKVFIVFIFLLTAFIAGLDLQKNFNSKKDVDAQREVLTKDLKFWEDFISKHNDYRDAYFQASVLEYRLGDISKAKEYIEKGLTLDPNSEEGKKIEEYLNK